MGKMANDWQEREYLLRWFGRIEGAHRAGGPHPEMSSLRRKVARKIVDEFGLSLAEAGRLLRVSTSTNVRRLSR
jgi:hypothetical protein